MPKLYALVIGINYYRTPSDGRQRFSSLSSCVRDASAIEEYIMECLRRRKVNNPEGYLTVLTSTFDNELRSRNIEAGIDRRGIQDYIKEPPRKRPTYHRIAETLQDILRKAEEGDEVLVTYSGHGSRIRSIVDADWLGKNPTSFRRVTPSGRNTFTRTLMPMDETLVTYDREVDGHDVRDWELNYLFGNMVKRGLRLTVFLDCCHAGGAMRAPDEDEQPEQPRGFYILDDQDKNWRTLEQWRNQSPLGPDLESIKSDWQDLMRRSARTPATMSTPVNPLIPYSIFAACLAHELSWEGTDGSGGNATTALRAVLEELKLAVLPHPERITLRHIYRYIFEHVYARGVKGHPEQWHGKVFQSPLLLGDVNSPFPGAMNIRAQPQVSTTASIAITLRSNSQLFLRAGSAHGVVKGSVYAVYLWYQDPETSTAAAEVQVVVTDVRPTVSVVLPVTSELPGTWRTLAQHQRRSWPNGCVARLISLPTTSAALVRLMDSIPRLSTDVYIPGEVPLKFTTDAPTPNVPQAFCLAKTPGGSGYNLQDGTGASLELSTNSSTSLARCIQNASHIAKYRLLSKINHMDPDLDGCFELKKDDKAPNDGYWHAKFVWPLETQEQTDTRYVNIVAFHFTDGPEYAVRKVYPLDGGDFESVDGADERTFTFQAKGGKLKVLAFFVSTNFNFWEMGPLEDDSGSGDGELEALGEKELPTAEVTAAEPPHFSTNLQDLDEEVPAFNRWCTLELSIA